MSDRPLRRSSRRLLAGAVAMLLLLPFAVATAALAPAPLPHAGSAAGMPSGTGPGAAHPSTSLRPAPVRHAAPARALTVISPIASYSSEPAPMGIADFGVSGTGAGARAYNYTSDEFQGIARIGSLNVAAGGSSHLTAFELNAMVVLERGGQNFTYWIQNGLHVDTSSKQFTIGGAYVWNFSSSTAKLGPGELVGNSSSIQLADTYIFIPGCSASFAGQCSTLGLPTTLEGRINVSEVAGLPVVAYEYDLGAGWVTYDRVTFEHLAGATIAGFTVDGRRPTPYTTNLFYDAEFDWVAAGGGSSGTDEGSSVALQLQFWNGHNFQATPGAWDFGGDTGETMGNVSVAPLPHGVDGTLGAELSSGSGRLGPIYNRSAIGFLQVSSPEVANGTLLVNGSGVAFAGGAANLTLPPGTYAISLEDYANASVRAVVTANATSYVDLAGAGRTAVEATGLAPNTRWGFTLGGISYASTASEIVTPLANGSYPIAFDRVPGYEPNGSLPTSLVVPSDGPLVVAWGPFLAIAEVDESGLPANTPWWVNDSGQLVAGNSSALFLLLANGTTNFTAGAAYEFVATPPNGTISVVDGRALPASVTFVYRATFVVGTVDPVGASVVVDGVGVPVVAGAFNATVIPGNVTVAASAPGYRSQTVTVLATPGNSTPVTLALAKLSTPSTNGSATTSGGPGLSTTDHALLAGGVLALAAVAALGWFLRRRSRSG